MIEVRAHLLPDEETPNLVIALVIISTFGKKILRARLFGFL